MKIEHIAIWTKDIEKMQKFYTRYFDAKTGAEYINKNKHFRSYFLRFEDGARLELMQKPEIPANQNPGEQHTGITHIAFSVGNREKVVSLTEQLKKDGYEIISEPRTTGDGYFESVVSDPEKNRIEITK